MNEFVRTVPEELKHSFFFPEDKMTISSPMQGSDFHIPFMYEAAHFLGEEGLRPWDDPQHSIASLLQEWLNVKAELQADFAMRNTKAALNSMRKGSGLFVEFLHWTNNKPSILNPEIAYNDLHIKPVNIEERLQFIIERPNLFHSYMQLCELFVEQEKGYKKMMAMKNMKK